MKHYLFISSRDLYESRDSGRLIELVADTRARQHRATVFLIQNGVLGARQGALHSECYQRLAKAGVKVIADAFSLRERAIGKLADGVESATMETLVDLLVEPGTKAIWH